MISFKKIKTVVTPLDKVNVDTDQIVPKQFLKLVQKSGFGKFLFYNWRYDDQEQTKSDFILNNPPTLPSSSRLARLVLLTWPVVISPAVGRFNCPNFSSSVILDIKSLIKISLVGIEVIFGAFFWAYPAIRLNTAKNKISLLFIVGNCCFCLISIDNISFWE